MEYTVQVGSALLTDGELVLTLARDAEILGVGQHQAHLVVHIREGETGHPYPRRFRAVKAVRVGQSWRYTNSDKPDFLEGFRFVGALTDFGMEPYGIYEEIQQQEEDNGPQIEAG